MVVMTSNVTAAIVTKNITVSPVLISATRY
jgi:hypothetical protein